MPYMEFPGVDYTEKDWDSSSAIVGGATDICGVMIIAQKGPINKPTLCNSIDQVIAKFGSYIADAYGLYSVKGFFQNGGRSLYVSRLAHYTDITDATTLTAKRAEATINDRRETGSEPTLTFMDKYDSAVGNSYGFKVIDEHRVNVKLTEANTANTNVIKVKVVRDFVVGDWVCIDDEAVKAYGQIVSINAADRTVTLSDNITQVFAVGSEVYTCDFKLEIYRKNVTGPVLEKEFTGCNMNPESPYYVCNLVNSAANGSSLVECVDEFADLEKVYEKLPAITEDIKYLSGGNDGLTDFCDMDIIGDPASKTGFYAFDDINEMIHVWCPESHSMSVIRAGFDYWTSRITGMYFSMVPSGLNPEGAANFRDEAGWNTSYGALYHNWGYVTDPLGAGDDPQKLIPLTGHVLGYMSKNDRENLDEYGSAFAGESAVLLGVNKLEFEVDSKNGGIMYGNKDRNVNPIVNLSGNGGIAIWGARTQSSVKKWFWIHARRIFIYVETTIVGQTRWVAFKNKNDTLYTQLTRRVTKFMRSVKGLRGTDDDERFEFVTGEAINDPEDPYVISRLGMNIVAIGEFVWFEFGQRPEGVSLAEI